MPIKSPVKKVISKDNLPTRLPNLLTAYLLANFLYYRGAPFWELVILGLLYLLLWTKGIIDISREESVDVLNEQE